MREKPKRKSWILRGFLISILVVIAFFCYPKETKAREWYEQLIPDGEFVNKDSMSESQIRDFLSSKGSYLANYSWNDKSASAWIRDEAQEHGINPKVILVTLQKEQSLVTLSSPSQTRLDWAMGYGAYSGCAPDGGWCTDYAGFGNQVAYAAYWMRNNYDLGRGPGSSHVGDTVSIQTRSWEAGLTSVYLSNRATALLYRYTPYIYNGNYNFYNLYRSWFGWSYMAVKSPESDAIYLVYNNTVYHIRDFTSFSILGLNWDSINFISNEALSTYSQGPSVTYLMKGSSEAIYVANNGNRYHIPNPTTFNNYGFNWEQLSWPGDELINSIPYTGALNNLIKGSGPEIYALDQGVKRHIKDLDTFNHFRFKWETITFLSNDFINAIPSSGFISRLIKGPGEKVYLIENGQRRWITSMTVFKRRGYRWSDIGITSNDLLLSLPEGAPIR